MIAKWDYYNYYCYHLGINAREIFSKILRTILWILFVPVSEWSAKRKRYSLKERYLSNSREHFLVENDSTTIRHEQIAIYDRNVGVEHLRFDHFSTRSWSQQSIQASYAHVRRSRSKMFLRKRKRKIRTTSRFARNGRWTRRKNKRVFGSGLASKMLFYPDNGSNAGSESVARRSVRWRSRVLRRGYEARFIIDARGVLPTSRRHNIVA